MTFFLRKLNKIQQNQKWMVVLLNLIYQLPLLNVPLYIYKQIFDWVNTIV